MQKSLNCRGDLLRTEITEFNVCYKVSGRLGVTHSYMLDYHDDYKASYYYYNNDVCDPTSGGRTKLQPMISGECNSVVHSYAGEKQNVAHSFIWAATKQTIAYGVQGPVRALYKGNTWCNGKAVLVMYPHQPNVCTVNVTDTMGMHTASSGQDYGPLNPRPLNQRAYFTTRCAADKVSFFVQNYREQLADMGMFRNAEDVLSEEELTDYRAIPYGHTKRCLFKNESDTVNFPMETVTPTCVTDGYDSWRASDVGCKPFDVNQ